MQRISLIGPGDVDFHYFHLLGLRPSSFNEHINKIAKVLAESNLEIELLPDKGVCFEVAKLYKEFEGKKAIATIPLQDRTFGISHLKEYANFKDKNEKRLFDEFIDSETWFKHNLIKGLMGEVILYLGSSPGTDGERNYAVYLYKLLSRANNEDFTKKVHPEIKAKNNFSVIVYTPFLLGKKLSKEEEAYMAKYGVNLIYVKNSEQLQRVLVELSH